MLWNILTSFFMNLAFIRKKRESPQIGGYSCFHHHPFSIAVKAPWLMSRCCFYFVPLRFLLISGGFHYLHLKRHKGIEKSEGLHTVYSPLGWPQLNSWIWANKLKLWYAGKELQRSHLGIAVPKWEHECLLGKINKFKRVPATKPVFYICHVCCRTQKKCGSSIMQL